MKCAVERERQVRKEKAEEEVGRESNGCCNANADATERGSRPRNQSTFGSTVLSTSSNTNIK